MTSQKRVAVFTGNPAYLLRKTIVEIDREVDGLSWLILVHSPKKSAGRMLKNQWRLLLRNGWRWVPYQLGNIRHRLKERNTDDPAPSCPGGEYTLEALESRSNVRLVRVRDIHAQASLALVKDFGPDLGLSLAAPVLRPPLFSIPALGTINLHQGKVPDYRGMPPAFWELWNDEQSVGCTVHWVEEKLDTGDIIRQTTVGRAKFSTVPGLQLQLDEIGVNLMREAVKDILLGTPRRHPQEPGGNTYRKPTLVQVADLTRRLEGLQPAQASLPVRFLKGARSTLGLAAHRLLLTQLLTPRIIVLLYHRVTDDVRNDLTVGIDQFNRQMTLLRRHCGLLSLGEVLESNIIPKSREPLVAVTFDDGYLDNYTNAAPILMRHGIPAAFFVSTGIIDTNGRFPHDVERRNPHIPLMKWDHLRMMRQWGFTIGSHTAHHIDCAAETEEVVRSELAESRDALKRELGITHPLLAYPYGGRQHMTPLRLELVKEAGYAGCLSAYGATNIGAVDPYNILRRGCHWEYSDRAFLFECLGLR